LAVRAVIIPPLLVAGRAARQRQSAQTERLAAVVAVAAGTTTQHPVAPVAPVALVRNGTQRTVPVVEVALAALLMEQHRQTQRALVAMPDSMGAVAAVQRLTITRTAQPTEEQAHKELL
jgi:hypothetical protein